MTDENHITSRRRVLEKASIGIIGATAFVSSASAATEKYYAEYRSQRNGSLGTGLSKLQVRVEWDSENGTIQNVDTSDIEGNGGGIRHIFEGISTKESSGGAGESFFQLYVEGDYKIEHYNNPNYTHWLDMTVRADGSHTANCNWNLELVDAGKR